MTQDFFDTIEYDYTIDQKLENGLASKVKLTFSLARVQQHLLEKLGYENLAPLVVNYYTIWLYQKDGKFHTTDDVLGKSTYRHWEHLYGDILLCLNTNGYNFCEPSNDNNNNETKYYKVENGVYYFLWDNDEYLELKHMTPMRTQYCKDEFEYIKRENYVAIKYHEKKKYGDSFMSEAERLIEKPRKDTIISREKEIYYIEVFTYYYNDRIVVYDGDEVIVYDKEFNVLYESSSDFEIWEINSTSYLLFPSEASVYDLSKGEEIQLLNSDDFYWDYVKIYKNIAVFYNIERFQVEDNSYYDEDGYYWSSDYNEEDIPTRNTKGHIFDSSFKLLRDFNVMGEISQLKEIGDTFVMIVNSSLINDNDTDSFYNVNGPNITRHNSKTNEDFSIPDISFRNMSGFDDLYVVKTKVSSSDIINFAEEAGVQYISEKCGVYYKTGWHEEKYIKIIDCKYDYIKSLPLNDDSNIYYAGVTGLDDDNKFDLYINHKIVLQGILFNRGHSVKVIKDGLFIQITNNDGKKGIIRNGNFVIDPLYKEIRTCVRREKNYDSETNITSETLKYLFAVSDGELFGICSPSGKLILPMKYSQIDIDAEFCIVLVRDLNTELDDKCDESVEEMLDYGGIYEIGHYDEEKDVVVIEKARFKDGDVLLDDEGNYVWDGCFRYLKEDDFSGWTDQELRDAADIAYEGHSRLELGLE